MNSLNNTKAFALADEIATIAMGGKIAQCVNDKLKKGIVVYLNGDLGAGKTTLTRGFITGMGHQGNVKSPTYTLVEPYDLVSWKVYHFDLYRLADAEELEYMGIRDYFSEQSCSFIEWPEKGVGMIPEADLVIDLVYDNEQRQMTVKALSANGKNLLHLL